MARSFASSRYNNRAVIITLRLAVFKMAVRFVDVSESKIDIFKENTVPQKTKDATKFGVKLFKGRLKNFSFASNTIY